MKINFVDFWPNFKKDDNYFYHLLKTKNQITIDEIDPDLIFCSCFGNEQHRYNNHRCKKIFYIGENRGLPQFEYDLMFTFEETANNNVYFPLFVMFLNWFGVEHSDERDISYLIDIEQLLKPVENVDKIIKNKSKFCAFIAGNNNANYRKEFCQELQKHARVDCPGVVLNNMPSIGGRGDQRHKVDFLKNYRFNIAFENSKHDGYVTEKILHPFAANCVPIYWGGSKVMRYFQPNFFVHVDGDFSNVVSRVLSITEEQYVEMIRGPVMNDAVLVDFRPMKILERIFEIL